MAEMEPQVMMAVLQDMMREKRKEMMEMSLKHLTESEPVREEWKEMMEVYLKHLIRSGPVMTTNDVASGPNDVSTV
ncbi:hypothetical protein ANCDUO_01427 [Ancylostoma duodenale]|uniref:Uncharacterized protein n=1 Tax=Ancylostoma duodenale TaxID=51022 RepID=A0A0C2H347_9BILA|nr:hypothetical protein ANCDUO_01427 [Ancylostoma duodenale]